MTRRLAAVLALLALFAPPACGGGDSAEDVLADTAANLGEIKSGDLVMELLFTAKGGERTGFRLEGPFSLEGDSLVEARLAYTQIAGTQTAETTFVSTGEKAFVEVDGTPYELPPELVDEIRAASGALQTQGGLERIELGSWIEDPEVSDGGEVGGAETDRVTARLNVANVINGLLGIASELGGAEAGPQLSGDEAETLQDAVKASELELFTGKEDRLLRRLTLEIDFGADAPEDIQSVIGAGVRFELAISRPNRPVNVAEPEDARPYSEFFGGA